MSDAAPQAVASQILDSYEKNYQVSVKAVGVQVALMTGISVSLLWLVYHCS